MWSNTIINIIHMFYFHLSGYNLLVPIIVFMVFRMFWVFDLWFHNISQINQYILLFLYCGDRVYADQHELKGWKQFYIYNHNDQMVLKWFIIMDSFLTYIFLMIMPSLVCLLVLVIFDKFSSIHFNLFIQKA